MSYGQGDLGFGGGGHQYGSSGGTSSSSMDYHRITQIVSSNTTKIAQHVKEINRLANDIGTDLDNSEIRSQLQQRQTTARKLCHDTERFLKDLKDLPPPETPGEKRERRVTLTKLANSFSNALNDFQRAQRESLEKEKQAMKQQQMKDGVGNEGNTLISIDNSTGQSQLQQQLSPNEFAQMQERENAIVQLEVRGDQAQQLVEADPLQRERDAELQNLEQDIADMAETFTEVHKLVHEQAEVIDSIEHNIEDAVVDIQGGNQQLRQAREHQQAARKKKFIIAIIVLVFILVLFLIIYFSWPSSN